MPDTPHLLVFEPDHLGHPLEWLEAIVKHLRERDDAITVSLVIAPELARPLAHQAAPGASLDLRIIALDPREVRLCRHRSLAISSLGRWWTMRRYLRQTGADHGHFLGLDLLSLALALGVGFAGRRVSGILFRPSVHYDRVGAHRLALRDRMRDARKDLLYRLMLRNQALRAVLTLDPYFPAFAADRYRDGHKVRAVPDPNCATRRIGPHDAGLLNRLPTGRVVMVLFGVLDRRKGLLTLLEAVRRLDPTVARNLALIVAGRTDAPVAKAASSFARRIAEQRPEAWVRFEDRHLAAGEIAALVGRSDLVLVPYQRFVGSSGVLLWAAAAGKPVLAPDYGLLGRLVREHRLGLTTDTIDPNRLAEALTAAVRHSPGAFFDPAATRRYSDAHAPATFARAVIDAAVGDNPVTG